MTAPEAGREAPAASPAREGRSARNASVRARRSGPSPRAQRTLPLLLHLPLRLPPRLLLRRRARMAMVAAGASPLVIPHRASPRGTAIKYGNVGARPGEGGATAAGAAARAAAVAAAAAVGAGAAAGAAVRAAAAAAAAAGVVATPPAGGGGGSELLDRRCLPSSSPASTLHCVQALLCSRLRLERFLRGRQGAEAGASDDQGRPAHCACSEDSLPHRTRGERVKYD